MTSPPARASRASVSEAHRVQPALAVALVRPGARGLHRLVVDLEGSEKTVSDKPKDTAVKRQ